MSNVPRGVTCSGEGPRRARWNDRPDDDLRQIEMTLETTSWSSRSPAPAFSRVPEIEPVYRRGNAMRGNIRRMKRVAVVAYAAGLVAARAVSAGGGADRAPVLGVVYGNSDQLVRLDPLTLQRLGSRSLTIPSFAYWDQSPNGSRIVFGGRAGTLRFVDPVKLEVVGTVPLQGFSDPRLAWVSPHALLIVDQASIAMVDPVAMRVRWRKTLPAAVRPFFPERVARTPSGLVFLLAPIDGSVGATTLVSADVSGRVRSVVLGQIQSGATQVSPSESLFTGAEPGLAVDPVGNTAFVVGGDQTVATVDLATLAVAYHDPTRTLAHAEKVLAGPTREAAWLGSGLLAVTGENDNAWLDSNKAYQESVQPAGLTIVDTRTWTSRLVDAGTSSVTFNDGLLLATGESWDTTAGSSASKPIGNGLSAYTPAGALAFHVLGKTPFQQVVVASGTAYALGAVATSVVKLPSGAILNTVKVSRPGSTPTPLIEYP